jgi:hypothetical protein
MYSSEQAAAGCGTQYYSLNLDRIVGRQATQDVAFQHLNAFVPSYLASRKAAHHCCHIAGAAAAYIVLGGVQTKASAVG